MHGMGHLKVYKELVKESSSPSLDYAYAGLFQNNKIHGEGILEYSDGRKITGIWAKGSLEQGTLAYPDG